MKTPLSYAALVFSVTTIPFFAACEQQSAAVTAPKYYEKERTAEEKAATKDAADPNPPTYFNN